MAKKIKDLADLNEGDQIIVSDHEYQMNQVEGFVLNALIPDDGEVNWVKVRVENSGLSQVVTLWQNDVTDGTTEIEMK